MLAGKVAAWQFDSEPNVEALNRLAKTVLDLEAAMVVITTVCELSLWLGRVELFAVRP